ncbi:hypothetical protein JSE7799_01898 [Jannaschia seosinensis]|uniref:Uncharacterized protein n=1 Tax=Jannaschia seosinensis TaxID=313367 RepID=A0A0M7B8R5_9RHOB|nr:hypothetical protein JSE7799_01898 [Jannaschia seosinensis]
MSACRRRSRIFMRRNPTLLVRAALVLLLLVHAALLFR